MVRRRSLAFSLVVAAGCGTAAPPPAPPAPTNALTAAETPVAADTKPTPADPPKPTAPPPGLKDKKADFVVTAAAFGKEYKENSDAAIAKYNGKVVELAGAARDLVSVRPHSIQVVAAGGKSDGGVLDSLVVCDFTPELVAKYGGVEGLSRGQSLKLKGVAGPAFVPYLTACEILETGPSTAVPATVAGIHADFETSADDARSKYKDKMVVCRVKVAEVTPDPMNPKAVKWSVADPDGGGKSRLVAFLPDLFTREDRLKEAGAVRPGDVVVLMANTTLLDYPLRLIDFRILKNPPPGVTLPAAKK